MKTIIRGLLAIAASGLALPSVGEPIQQLYGNATPVTTAQPKQSPREEKLEEILVTGSRLRATTEIGPSPVITFDREAIDRTGASSLPEVLRHLPQQSFTVAEEQDFSGAQFAQLRGLPAGATVVLLNGRRIAPSAVNITQNAFDLNSIPLAAIERVEVLTDAASAVYGADAMGGVVNVILKKDIPQPVLDLRYGGTKGGAQERRASLSSGYSNSRFRAALILDYLDRDPLLGSERNRWLDQDFRRFGGMDHRSTLSNPGNVISVTSANLPGLPSRFAAVPAGSSGVGLTPADFLAATGTENQNRVSLRQYESIVLDRERHSAAAFAELDVTEHTSAFVEGLYTEEHNVRQSSPAGAQLTVPATNAFNPFGVPVSVRYLFEGLGPTGTTIDTDWFSATAGMRGQASESWDWEFSASKTKGTSFGRYGENRLNRSAAASLLASQDPATTINLFQDGPGANHAILTSLVGQPTVSDDSSSNASGTAFVRGTLLNVPAGGVDIVVGGSRSMEEIHQGSSLVGTHGDRTSSAAFSEVRVPLVDTRMDVFGVRELSLKVGARYDRYSDFGETFNAQYGLVWSPVAGLSIRASTGTSFSPPSLFFLHQPRTSFPATSVTDPRRNDEAAFVDFTFGGNRNLSAEEGRAFTTGLVLAPPTIPGLQISASYWRVAIEDRVSVLGVNLLLANEERFTDRIVRAQPSAADAAVGLPGPLVSVDTSAINFAQLNTSGIDWAISYVAETPCGRISPSLSGTWTDTYEATDFPGTAPEERAGIVSIFGTIPNWRAVATLGWERGPISLSATARYVHDYKDAFYNEGRSAPNGRTLPAQTLLDLQGRFEIGEMNVSSLLSGFTVTAGVTNVFDEEPRFSDVTIGYDAFHGDLIGRWAYVNISKAF